MPTRDYMVVDPRHDHSIRVPRPDLSVTLGTPNACNQCHQDKQVTWAAAQVKQWYGKPFKGYQQYAYALDAGRKGTIKAGEILAEQIRNIETPNITRASAISLLPPYLDESNIDVLQKGLKDEEGNAISIEDMLNESYFLDLVGIVLNELMLKSFMGKQAIKKLNEPLEKSMESSSTTSTST